MVLLDCSDIVACSLLLFFSPGYCQLPVTETNLDSPSDCAGQRVNATCPVSQSIAINTIRVGVQPSSQNCNATQTAGDGSGCCDTISGCEFDFPLTDNLLFHSQCNGRQSCNLGIQIINVVHGGSVCNTTIYPQYTQYMYFNIYCIDGLTNGDAVSVKDKRTKDRSLDVGCSAALRNAGTKYSRSVQMTGGSRSGESVPLYLESPGYPNLIPDSITDSSCSVEIDNCNAVISVYTIDRNLADYTNSTLCNKVQSLSIIDQHGTALANWTCLDNTYSISQSLQSTDNYITVNFTNTMTGTDGRFWIGFEATMASNISIKCPAVDREHCLPTTSTTTSTTSTTATTSTSTSSSTSTTSVNSTSTSSSTTETTTSSTTSMTTTTQTSSSTTRFSTSSTSNTSDVMTEAIVDVAASTSSSTDITLIIVVCSCLAGVMLVVVIIGLVIWRKQRKRKSTEEDAHKLIDNGSSTRSLSGDSNRETIDEHSPESYDVDETNDVDDIEKEKCSNDDNNTEKEMPSPEPSHSEMNNKETESREYEDVSETKESQDEHEEIDNSKSIEDIPNGDSKLVEEIVSIPTSTGVQIVTPIKNEDEEAQNLERKETKADDKPTPEKEDNGPRKDEGSKKGDAGVCKKGKSKTKSIEEQSNETEGDDLSDLVNIELYSTSSMASGMVTSSNENQTTPSEHEQDHNVVISGKKLDKHRPSTKAPKIHKIPFKKPPKIKEDSKRPTTPYEHFYKHVAKAFAGPEFLERRITRLIQERRDMRRRRSRRRRKNNTVEPSDSTVEQNST